MSTLDRRSFLELTLGSLTVPALAARLAAAPRRAGAEAPVLVLLELRGGNDGLNTLIPFEDDLYHRARPSLAVEKRAVLALDELTGLHPFLERLHRRFADGRAAAWRGVGYEPQNLSHFTSRDIWNSAVTDGPREASGWLGAWLDRRPAEELSPLSMLALGSEVVPHALRGRRSLPPAVHSLQAYRFDARPDSSTDHGDPRSEARARARAMERLATLSGDAAVDGPLRRVEDSLAVARASSAELASALPLRGGGDYPPGGLGRDLRAVAGVLAAGLPTRVFHVVQDGYDTHVSQRRLHGELMADLDAALDAFLADLEAAGLAERVLVVTLSEFGRRVAESGVDAEAGTDHGAGSCVLAFGPRLVPGVHGGPDDLEHLDETGNLVPRTDFRRLYATLIERWLGGDAAAVLGAPFDPLELIA